MGVSVRISVIKNNKIENIILPDRVEGSYWITDTDSNDIKTNLICIEADNGRWKLVSNRDVYVYANGVNQPYAYLSVGSFCYIKNETNQTTLLVHASPLLTNYSYYEVTDKINEGLTVGSDADCYITYPTLSPKQMLIKKENEKFFVNVEDGKSGVYLNDIRIKGKTEIRNGDTLFVLGLKICLLIVKGEYKNQIYLMVNNEGTNIKVHGIGVALSSPSSKSFEENEEETEYPLYQDKDYFHKSLRFFSNIKELKLQVDAPPAKQEEPEQSMLLTIGPMLTMSMTSMVTGYTAVNSVLSGDSTWAKAAPSLVICGAMFATMFLWPMFSRWYQKKNRKRKEKERQEKYSKYIETKRAKIVEAKKEQTAILINNNPPLKDCVEMIMQRYASLWQRRLEDEDYLTVSLGNGNIPMKIDIKYPEDHFTMAEDNLKDMVSALGNEPKNLENVPIPFSFIENYISGLIGDEKLISDYMKTLLIQILAFHAYDNLKIVVLTDEEKAYKWEFLKDIPHCFMDDKSLRFFATNNDEYKEVCYYLDKVFNANKERFGQNNVKIEDLDKYYLIITDSYKSVKNFDIINNILDNKLNYGFSLFILDNKITKLPDQLNSFIQLTPNKGELYDKRDVNGKINFVFDKETYVDYELITKKLANIPIEFKNNEEGQLPNKLGFLEMYDVGKIEQLNSPVRWKNSNPMMNLAVPVGYGKNGEKVSIDLHEKYHGPHGLVAGMTGSGKSEFIITYILSMAINYHPYEVQFILIDYKGGGLAGAFENKTTGLKLPHLVGTITNLDANEIKRSLASIESELKRRQALFNKAREASGESTIDIYKYQRLYREGVIDTPVSHLFIISDEFAELKSQQPEFMAQLISTARIGRSLGVHLILATQKPSGVVDPQIWSNTRFRVSLRVQDKSDSNEIIKCPDAAFLKQTGRFYFQVGYNEVFLLGQAAWAGGKYIPTEKVNKTIDSSINFINNIGYPIKNVETKEKKNVQTTAQGEELLNIVKYLDEVAKTQNIKTTPLWLDKIPEDIRIPDLASKYNYQKEQNIINPIIGEYDIPKQQSQALLTLPITKLGNTLVYGASGSGKENFITTLIYSSMLYYDASEVNYYLVDFGSEALKMFKKSPIVGDMLYSDDDEKIKNLFKMLNDTIEQRKELFADYNGDYQTYCKNSGKTVPSIIVIINNYEAYQELFTEYDDTLNGLTRECNKYGIHFIITVNTPNGLRFKLRQNFSVTYALQQNNDDDFVTILGNCHKNYPAKIFGRGIIKKDDEVFEFQTALAYEKENIAKFIKEECQKLSSGTNVKAKSIPVLPKTISYSDIQADFGKGNKIIIGLNKATLETSKFDFIKNYITLCTSNDITIMPSFINPLINQMIATNYSKLYVINAEEFDVDEHYRKYYNYCDQEFNTVFEELLNVTTDNKKKYEESNFNKAIFKGQKPTTCIIIGIDSFKSKLNADNKNKLGDLLESGKDLGTINFIIVDSIDKIKKFEFESWYKNAVNPANGIWIGNGVQDQFSLKITQKVPEMKDIIPPNFCFVVNRGKAEYVKFVENLTLKE